MICCVLEIYSYASRLFYKTLLFVSYVFDDEVRRSLGLADFPAAL